MESFFRVARPDDLLPQVPTASHQQPDWKLPPLHHLWEADTDFDTQAPQPILVQLLGQLNIALSSHPSALLPPLVDYRIPLFVSQQAASSSGNASLVGPPQHSDVMRVPAPNCA